MPGGHLDTHSSLVSFLQRSTYPILTTLLLGGVTLVLGEPLDYRTVVIGALSANLVIWCFPLAGLYRSRRTSRLVERWPRLLAAWGLIIASLALVGFVTKTTADFSRRVILIWAATAQVALLVADVAVGKALRALRARGRNSRLAVIAGAGQAAAEVVERVRAAPEWGLRLAGVFDDDLAPGTRAHGLPVLGRLDEVAAQVTARSITHVYVALPLDASERVARLLDALCDTTASVYLVPFAGPLLTVNFSLQSLGGLPVYAIHETPFSDAARLAGKRASDVLVASLGLIVSAPLFVAIAIAVKLGTPGPVFFRQRRSGLNGREFRVYKFRTMTVAEDGAEVLQARRDDPRVTRVGAFLRRTSLDELPQLLNVLAGDMSVVGPRPHAVAHHDRYRKEIRGYMLRHLIKPGITGWAQIHGLRGETRSLDRMERRIELDLHYVRNWSLALDLQILLRTPLSLFQHRDVF